MKNFLNFLKYNNTVPLVLGFLFLGTGAAFAASPEARSVAAAAVLSQQSQVVSVDNRYIVGKNLDTYTPRVRIDKVTEDPDYYHVSYTFTTIDIVDYIWKDVLKSEVMHVSKADLGQYGDLGLYVTAQLKQIVDRELAYLKDVQIKESKQVSRAIVATTYGGLVGKFLDSSTEALPGYVPVVTPPVVVHPDPEVPPAAPETTQSPTEKTPIVKPPAPADRTPLISLQILGSNPVRVAVGSAYSDLGVYLDDPRHTNAPVQISLDGLRITSVSINTSTSSVHIIEYKATDPAGNGVKVRRIVLVGDAADPGGAIDFSGPGMPIPQPVSESRDTPPVQVISPVEPVPTPAATSTPHVEPTPVVEPASPTATSTPQPDPAPQTSELAPPAVPAAALEQSTSAPAL